MVELTTFIDIKLDLFPGRINDLYVLLTSNVVYLLIPLPYYICTG